MVDSWMCVKGIPKEYLEAVGGNNGSVVRAVTYKSGFGGLSWPHV